MIRMKARDMLERRMRRGREDVVFTGVGVRLVGRRGGCCGDETYTSG